jgi:hypothetical protein
MPGKQFSGSGMFAQEFYRAITSDNNPDNKAKPHTK